MERVYEFLKNARVFYLATVDNGEPRVRPFGAVDIFNGKLYIQTGRIKPCYRQMKDNPKVEICGMYDGEWIRLTATAVENTDIAAEVHMIEQNPSLASRYQPGDGNCVVFSLENATAVIASFTKEPVVIEF